MTSTAVMMPITMRARLASASVVGVNFFCWSRFEADMEGLSQRVSMRNHGVRVFAMLADADDAQIVVKCNLCDLQAGERELRQSAWQAHAWRTLHR
jgi:hypothetical protein